MLDQPTRRKLIMDAGDRDDWEAVEGLVSIAIEGASAWLHNHTRCKRTSQTLDRILGDAMIAVANCSDCGGELSKSDTACPHCGRLFCMGNSKRPQASLDARFDDAASD